MILREIFVVLIRDISLHTAYCKLHLGLINNIFGLFDIPILKEMIETSALRAFSAVTGLTVHRRSQVAFGKIFDHSFAQKIKFPDISCRDEAFVEFKWRALHGFSHARGGQ